MEKTWLVKEQASKQWHKLHNNQPPNVHEVKEMHTERQWTSSLFKTLATEEKIRLG